MTNEKTNKNKTLGEKQNELRRALRNAKENNRHKEKLTQVVRPNIPAETRQWQMEAVAYQLSGNKNITAIAKEVGICRDSVSKFLHSQDAEDLKKEVVGDDFIKEMRRKIRNLAGKALNIIAEVLSSSDPDYKQTKVKLAQDILDRAGIRESEKKEIKHTHILEGIKDAIARASNKEKEAARKPVGHA